MLKIYNVFIIITLNNALLGFVLNQKIYKIINQININWKKGT